MVRPACVGALIRDERHRVFVQRRTMSRRLLPGTWDIVGGHLEVGEGPEQALAREIEEETGWTLRRIEAPIADWTWEHDGTIRHERDYLVEVDGDLDAPRLEAGKHDACAWVGPDDLDLMQGRTDGDRRLRDIVAKATRTRLTSRLRLEPLGHEHVEDLVALADVEGNRCLDVGWIVRQGRWGRGYATEIGRAGLAFAFDHLRAEKVVAFTEPHNERSRAVMARLGMRFSRHIVHASRPMVLYTARRDEARGVIHPGAG